MRSAAVLIAALLAGAVYATLFLDNNSALPMNRSEKVAVWVVNALLMLVFYADLRLSSRRDN